MNTVVFVSDRLKASRVEDMTGLPIGVIKGDYSGEYLRTRYRQLVVEEYIDTDALFSALKGGKLFAFADDVPRSLQRMNTERGMLGTFRPVETLYSKELNAGVRKGDAALLSTIESGMRRIGEDEYRALVAKWVPYVQTDYGFRLSWTYAMWISIGIALSFFIVGFFVLQAQVRSKTKDLRRTLGEKEALIKELRDALDKVKRLDGLIPICANCKKIRNDTGYWEQVESYVRERSDARFSHGICPECAKQLYGDILDQSALNDMR